MNPSRRKRPSITRYLSTMRKTSRLQLKLKIKKLKATSHRKRLKWSSKGRMNTDLKVLKMITDLFCNIEKGVNSGIIL